MNLGIEQISTIYFDPDSMRLPPYIVGRAQVSGGRGYFKYELPVRLNTSLTTVQKYCSPTPYGLMQWYMNVGEKEAKRYSELTANYGTLMHREIGNFCKQLYYGQEGRGLVDYCSEIVENYTTEIEYYQPECKEWKYALADDLTAWADFVAKRKVKVMAVELVLVSDVHRFGSAIDIVCSMDFGKSRIIGLINMKSGRHGFYAENAQQLLGEKILFEENYPDIKIDKIFNWRPTDWRDIGSEKYKLQDQTDKANMDKLLLMFQLAKLEFTDDLLDKPQYQLYGQLTYGSDPVIRINAATTRELIEKRIKKSMEKFNPVAQ